MGGETGYPRFQALPPAPITDPNEIARVECHRLRRRIMDGDWLGDLNTRASEMLSTTRIDKWGPPSLARNLLQVVTGELAVLYDEPIVVHHADEDAAAAVSAAMDRAGLVRIQQRMQQYTVALGSCYIAVEAGPAGSSAVIYRVVTPDVVTDRPDPADPLQPESLEHYVMRAHDGEAVWQVDAWTADGVTTRLAEGGEVVATGPGTSTYVDSAGNGVLPWVLYHDGYPTHELHSPHHRASLVMGTLDVAIQYWMLMHTFRDASFPVRYMAGLLVEGTGSEIGTDQTTTVSVDADPAKVQTFVRDPDYEGTPLIGQWAAGGDIRAMMEVMEETGARLAVEAGISPTDLHRSAPNRSGIAISTTNEGKRRQQRRYASMFRTPDARLAALTAVALNATDGTDWPTDGYSVLYKQMALSPDELEARRRHVLELVDARLMSRLDAYQEIHPGIVRTQAQKHLTDIDAVVRGVLRRQADPLDPDHTPSQDSDE
jgi:hypothetical protein